MTEKGHIRYDAERRLDAFHKRYLSGFTGLLFRALRGDAKPLCDKLLSEAPLSAENREGLAWLINKKFQALPRGRRPGRSRTDQLDAAWEVYDIVCQRREQEREEAGRQRLPKGRLDKLIDEVIAEKEDRCPEIKGDLTQEYVRSMLKR